MDQGGGHREVGNCCDHIVVDGGEGSDVAFAFGGQTNGGVVVGPSIGDGSFFRIDRCAEFNGFSQSVVANHLALRLIHNHVLDLQSAVGVADGQLGAVGSGSNKLVAFSESEDVVAFHTTADHLEAEDSASADFNLFGLAVQSGDEQVGTNAIGTDHPVFTSHTGFVGGDGTSLVGQVLAQVDVKAESRHVALVVEFHVNGHHIIEVAVVIIGHREGDSAGLFI